MQHKQTILAHKRTQLASFVPNFAKRKITGREIINISLNYFLHLTYLIPINSFYPHTSLKKDLCFFIFKAE